MKGSVRKRGNKWYWYCDIGKENGKRKRIERVGGKTKKEAQDALRKFLNEVEVTGTYKDQTKINVSEYFDYWYEQYVLINCKYNTQTWYKRIIDKHIKPNLGLYPLKNLSPAMLQEFLNKKYIEGYTKSTLSGFYGVLSGALKAAVYPYQFIKENPMTYVKMPKYDQNKATKKEHKVITLEDFNRIIERFPFGTSFFIPLQIAFHTGMRGSEVCGLTWDCVDLEKGFITVNKILVRQGREHVFGTPKTQSSHRTIKIGTTLIGILKKHRKRQMEKRLEYGKYYTESNMVCTKENGETITTDSIKYLSRIVNYELMISFNFHSLRHTHATMLLESGANMKDIQVRLGHSTMSMTADTYSHVTDKMQNDTVNLLEKIIAK